MNRAQRREEERRQRLQKKHAPYLGMTRDEKLAALFKNGISADDLKKEYHRGYEHGVNDAGTPLTKLLYASVCLALNDLYGFGRHRCYKVLEYCEQNMLTTLTSKEAEQAVYDRIGLAFDDDEPFNRIRET